jgi:hypothetical protein
MKFFSKNEYNLVKKPTPHVSKQTILQTYTKLICTQNFFSKTTAIRKKLMFLRIIFFKKIKKKSKMRVSNEKIKKIKNFFRKKKSTPRFFRGRGFFRRFFRKKFSRKGLRYLNKIRLGFNKSFTNFFDNKSIYPTSTTLNFFLKKKKTINYHKPQFNISNFSKKLTFFKSTKEARSSLFTSYNLPLHILIMVITSPIFFKRNLLFATNCTPLTLFKSHYANIQLKINEALCYSNIIPSKSFNFLFYKKVLSFSATKTFRPDLTE